MKNGGSHPRHGHPLRPNTDRTKFLGLSLEDDMRVVNMHEAKTHLSRLVQAAAQGEPFIIARAGTPMVKVVAVDAPEPGKRCAGRGSYPASCRRRPISTAWGRARSSGCSKATHEAAARYAHSAVGGGRTGTLAGRRAGAPGRTRRRNCSTAPHRSGRSPSRAPWAARISASIRAYCDGD